MTDDLEFTNNWFGYAAEGIWKQIFPVAKPKKILEIGSYEGRSTCFIIKSITWSNDVEIHSVDTWKGGVEHTDAGVTMRDVENRFDRNIEKCISQSKLKVDFKKHKGASDEILPFLIASGKKSYFDFIYIDGSHQAPDVLLDSVMAFKLTKVGGIIGFDDYTWFRPKEYGKDPLDCPKISIDSFTNIYFRKVNYINTSCAQVYVQKTSE